MQFNNLQINTDTQISILIGENGCGKSQILGELARHMVWDQKVIAIATAIYDKFPRRNYSKNFDYMGSRLGRFVPREAIKKAFSKVDLTSPKALTEIFNVLDYVKFDEMIGFKVRGLNHDYDSVLTEAEDLSESQKDEIDRIFYSLTHGKYNAESEILWFSRKHYAKNLADEFLIELVSLEKTLKKHKLIKAIDIYLSKQGSVFPLSDASSGELSLISTFVFISSVIDYGSVILIDEPENSLHPKWQKDYIKMIMDLFTYYEPKIIAATHSPIVVSGLHQENSVDIHKYTPSGFELDTSGVKNAEEIYSELFNIVTPASRNLSNQCADLLNRYSEGSISYASSIELIELFKLQSFDEQQKEFLEGVKGLLGQIKEQRKDNG